MGGCFGANKSKSSAENKSKSSAENKSKSSTENKSKPLAENKSIPSAENKSIPLAENKSIPSAENKSKPLAENKSIPSAENKRESSAETSFSDECIRVHNAYRTRHGVGPLRQDIALTKSAQDWANHLASINKFEHSKNRVNVGENIAMKSGAPLNAQGATNMWYSEIKDYRFQGEENVIKCGHFSQVVWEGTNSAGFGKARASNGTEYAVGQYAPAGNMRGQWGANVKPSKDGRTDLIGGA